MKLVVGLGNPGRKYALTRHNVGFEVLEQLAERLGGGGRKRKFEGEVFEAGSGDGRLLLLWPHTFMNRSGGSVAQAVGFYRIDVADVLVVCDDFQLPLARIRFRPRGSAGGQKGLGDILQALGTQEVGRMRLGVGPLPPRREAVEFVLGRFSRTERDAIEPAIARAADGVIRWVEAGMETCMNEFNAPPGAAPSGAAPSGAKSAKSDDDLPNDKTKEKSEE